jgi:hypothetical protein
MSRDSPVGIATGYELDERGVPSLGSEHLRYKFTLILWWV